MHVLGPLDLCRKRSSANAPHLDVKHRQDRWIGSKNYDNLWITTQKRNYQAVIPINRLYRPLLWPHHIS